MISPSKLIQTEDVSVGARGNHGSIRGCWMGKGAVSRVTEQVMRTLFDLVRDSPEEGGASVHRLCGRH